MRSALRGFALVSTAVIVVLTAAVAAAPGRSVSQMTLSVSPAKPAFGSIGTVTIRGTADETAMPAVVAVSGSVCPARVPSLSNAFWSEDSSLTLGAFTRKVRVFIQTKTLRRFCAYLQPAVQGVNDGDPPEISPGAPLVRAEVALSGAAAAPLRGVPVSGVSGGTGKAPARRSC